MLSLVNIFHIIKKFPESRSSIEITGERSSPPKFIKVTVSTHDFIRIILSLIYFQDVNMNSNSEQAPPTINLNLNSDKTSSALYSNLGSGDQSYFNFEKSFASLYQNINSEKAIPNSTYANLKSEEDLPSVYQNLSSEWNPTRNIKYATSLKVM